MDEQRLYRQISESIRQDILSGRWKSGDRLPPVRDMAQQWNCTVGTIQHAYRELALQGLVTSRAGQGTHVAEGLPPAQHDLPMRRALLTHRAEAFLLEALTSGYRLDEIDQAVRDAMDRWRTAGREIISSQAKALRFAGSHDLALTWLASRFHEAAPGYTLELNFTGSLGGLVALVEGRADMAGCHLWDEETGTYNIPYVRRLLPGRRTALVTLAERRLGLILPQGNPAGIRGLADLARPGLRFINRQAGSGSRVWLDLELRRQKIDPAGIMGFENEMMTHSAVARAVAEGTADAGIGLEAAAISYGLDFVFLTLERYDLVIPAEGMDLPAAREFISWLKTGAAREIIQKPGGYETTRTGEVAWVA